MERKAIAHLQRAKMLMSKQKQGYGRYQGSKRKDFGAGDSDDEVVFWGEAQSIPVRRLTEEERAERAARRAERGKQRQEAPIRDWREQSDLTDEQQLARAMAESLADDEREVARRLQEDADLQRVLNETRLDAQASSSPTQPLSPTRPSASHSASTSSPSSSSSSSPSRPPPADIFAWPGTDEHPHGPNIYLPPGWLIKKQSKIAGAGQGIFTTHRLLKNTVIGKYSGEYIKSRALPGEYMTTMEHKNLPQKYAISDYVMSEKLKNGREIYSDRVIDGDPRHPTSNYIAIINGYKAENEKNKINVKIAYADVAMRLSNKRGLTPGVYYLTTKEIRPQKDKPIELICDYSSTYFDQTSKEDRALEAVAGKERTKLKGVDDFSDALVDQGHHDPESFDQERFESSLRNVRETRRKNPMRPSEVRQFKKELGVDDEDYVPHNGPEDLISDRLEELMEEYEEEQDKEKKRKIRKEINRIRRVNPDVREELDDMMRRGLRTHLTEEEREEEEERIRIARAYEHYVSQYTNSQYALNEMDPSGKRVKGKALDAMHDDDFHKKGGDNPHGWIGTKEKGSLYPDAIPRKPRVLPNRELGPRRWTNIRNPTPEGMRGDGVKMIGYPEGSYEMQRMKRVAGELRRAKGAPPLGKLIRDTDAEGYDTVTWTGKHKDATGKYTIPVQRTMPRLVREVSPGEEGIRRKAWKKEIAKRNRSRKSAKSAKSAKSVRSRSKKTT